MNAAELEEIAKEAFGEECLLTSSLSTEEKPFLENQNDKESLYEYTDADGVLYEWDFERNGWFPKIDESFVAAYQYNYGASTATPSEQHKNNSASIINKTFQEQPKKSTLSEWKELSDDVNPNVYVTGLPTGISVESFASFMSKCGIIKEDPETGQLKVKLYKNEDGTLKGDGLCTYLKVESVALALEFLDGTEIEDGYKVSLSRAKFEKKGEFILKRKRKTGKSQQSKLLSWTEKKGTSFVSKKVASVVILKNMFDPKDFDDDPVGIQEISEDVRSEGEKCGKVNKVIVFDRHSDGVVSIRFKTVDAAELCVKLMNGRWFGGRQVVAQIWDGVTDYKVEETEHEREDRLKKWDQFISGGKTND